MSMYVRIKRKSTTIFMHVEDSDTIKSIKHRVSEILKEEESKLGLFPAMDKSKELADLATVRDQEIQNDQIIYLLHKSNGAWEEFDVSAFEGDEKDGA